VNCAKAGTTQSANKEHTRTAKAALRCVIDSS
jgi:hypothetical protein